MNWFSLDFWLFSYESHDEPFSDALRKLEVGFNVVVDAATSAITERFSTLENVGNRFGVLINFPSLVDEELAEQCNALSTALLCTLKGTLIWTVESLWRKSRTTLNCHQKQWASLSFSLLCMIRIYWTSTPTFGLLSGLHLLCQSLWLKQRGAFQN